MTSLFQANQISTKDRRILFWSKRWIIFFGLGYGIFVLTPFLAPVFMKLGWELPGKVIYSFYSTLCHQLPERSFFLFGSKGMYSLSEIQVAWQNTIDPLVLRKFNGSPVFGWKVAWSDRMISMYTSIWIFGLLWWFTRHKLRPLPFWGLILLAMPMVIDGSTHLISDVAGIGQGFRDQNLWLATITNNSLPASFYYGDAFGSLNSWLRLITGTLFGMGVVLYGFPYLQETFDRMAKLVEAKIHARQQILVHAFRDSASSIEGIDLPEE